MKTPRRWRLAAISAVMPVILVFSGCATQTERRAISAVLISGRAGYSPETIQVQKENQVRLRVGNSTTTEHGFAIEGYKVTRTVKPGETVEIRFRAGRGGTFKIYCQLHPAHGIGTFIVQ